MDRMPVLRLSHWLGSAERVKSRLSHRDRCISESPQWIFALGIIPGQGLQTLIWFLLVRVPAAGRFSDAEKSDWCDPDLAARMLLEAVGFNMSDSFPDWRKD